MESPLKAVSRRQRRRIGAVPASRRALAKFRVPRGPGLRPHVPDKPQVQYREADFRCRVEATGTAQTRLLAVCILRNCLHDEGRCVLPDRKPSGETPGSVRGRSCFFCRDRKEPRKSQRRVPVPAFSSMPRLPRFSAWDSMRFQAVQSLLPPA